MTRLMEAGEYSSSFSRREVGAFGNARPRMYPELGHLLLTNSIALLLAAHASLLVICDWLCFSRKRFPLLDSTLCFPV
jgi:hypothetical protein